MSRFAYEQAVLAEVASEQALTLEEFVGLPAYIGRESSYDTWYDGHMVRIEIRPPALAEAGDVVVDILGPYWDRIFRCGFHEVFRIETLDINLISIPEIQGIELASVEGGRICVFRTHDKSQEFRLTFSTAEVTRRMLRTPLERELVGS